MTTTAETIRQNATRQDVEAAGGQWDDAECAFVFADGSAGRFVDPEPGTRWVDTQDQTVLVFAALEG